MCLSCHALSPLPAKRGMPMSLNNSTQETIELLDASGQVVDSFSYQGSQPDVAIQTMH